MTKAGAAMRDRIFIALLVVAGLLIVGGVATFSVGVALIVAGVAFAGGAALTLFADEPKTKPGAASADAVPAYPVPEIDLQSGEIE